MVSSKPNPVAADEKNQLLFGTAHLEGDSPAAVPLRPDKSASLPNLGDKIEFFQLTPEGAKQALRVELAGVVSGHALIVRHAPGDEALSLTAGVTYEARLFTGARLFRFATELLEESVGPFGCHFLQYPESVVRASVRKHQRIPTSLPGKLRSGEYQRPAANVTIDNISAIGAMVSTKEDLLTVGQRAQLSMNLSLSTDSRVRPVTVFVEVRNRRAEGEQFSYGLEFVQMTDEVRRDIKDFVLDSVALL